MKVPTLAATVTRRQERSMWSPPGRGPAPGGGTTLELRDAAEPTRRPRRGQSLEGVIGVDAIADGPGGDLGPVAEVQLGQDVLDVAFGGPSGDHELGSDLAVGQAPSDQFRHLP